jgi:hypothetical protein
MFCIEIEKFDLGAEVTQASTSTEQKSRTLPSHTEQSSTQQAPSGKKKSGGFFSMKRK